MTSVLAGAAPALPSVGGTAWIVYFWRMRGLRVRMLLRMAAISSIE